MKIFFQFKAFNPFGGSFVPKLKKSKKSKIHVNNAVVKQ